MNLPDLHGWTIVFDLDGTLVDTAPDLHASLNHALTQDGYKAVPFNQIAGMIGDGAKAMIVKGLTWQDVDANTVDLERLWAAFLTYYRANICVHSQPFPGAEDALTRLSSAGAITAVCTNKVQSLSENVLSGLGLSRHFAAIVGADAVVRKKPDPDHILQAITRAGGNKGRAIMIGDSQTDEKAARYAGLPFLFVNFGYGPEPDEDAKVSARCETYDDILAQIGRIVA